MWVVVSIPMSDVCYSYIRKVETAVVRDNWIASRGTHFQSSHGHRNKRPRKARGGVERKEVASSWALIRIFEKWQAVRGWLLRFMSGEEPSEVWVNVYYSHVRQESLQLSWCELGSLWHILWLGGAKNGEWMVIGVWRRSSCKLTLTFTMPRTAWICASNMEGAHWYLSERVSNLVDQTRHIVKAKSGRCTR